MWGRGTELGGRYTLTERLGGGAMGEVWRGEDGVLGRQVAVKILLPALLDDATFMERFRREARLLASINHPGIVEVHDYGESGEDAQDRVAYIVMELITGRPLDVVLEESGPLPVDRALGIVAQALDALHAAHQRGIVHRDIKPSNLMLREDGRVAVTDFGIASAVAGTKITSSDAILGTALYVAPERAEGAASNPASDLYSIGVLCYEMLIGKPPFTGETALEIVLKHVREPAPALPDSFGRPVRDLVATALAKLPGERFANAAEMAAVVRGAAQGAPVAEAIASRTTPLVAARPAAAVAPVAVAPAAVAAVAPAAVEPAAAEKETQPVVSSRQPWIRRRFVLPVLIPCGVTVVVGSALLIDQTPFSSNAATAPSRPPAAAAAGSPAAAVGPGAPAASASGAAPSGSASLSASASASSGNSSAPPAGSPAGSPGAAVPPPPGGGGTPRSGGGNSGGSGSGAGSNGGSTSGSGSAPGGGNSGSTNGGSTQPPPPTQPAPNPPPSSVPPSSAPPAGCGASSAIVNVGDGLKVGLADGNPSGTGTVVMGGSTQYGWVRSADQTWSVFHACNMNDSILGVAYYPGTSAQLIAQSGGGMADWTIVGAPTGVNIKDYLGQNCLTDNGAGHQLTLNACTPGDASQEWRIP
ncbi:serine/threonine-protein kinase [Kitasatospora sp. GAS1066B]|uniref:serine/threonine-protein kinase n=1 Tax=Kitasatospora sp. GAS1066B TaxID=3156271 RepID=UPI003513C199